MPYNPTFIAGFNIPLPSLIPRIQAVAFNGGLPIEHPRFSVIFNQERGFAIATGHNIDGNTIIPKGTIKRKDSFRFDTKVPNQLQVDNDQGYKGSPTPADNPWDRGHLVRRRSLHWGNEAEARIADKDSYFWTNIVPQHEDLHDSAWGDIEDFMLQVANDSNKKACVFQGPILTPDDPLHTNMPGEDPIQIPAGFWKIFCIKHQSKLRAACFLVWQRDFDDLDLSFNPILEQVRITTIEYLTGLIFPAVVRQADALQFGAPAQPLIATAIAEAAVTGVAQPLPSRQPGGAITSAKDIYL